MTMPIFGERGVKFGLIAAIFIPSLLQMKLQASSLATGLLMVAIFIFLAALVVISLRSRLLFLSWSVLLSMLFAFCLILVHYLVAGVFVSLPQDWMRFIASLAGFALFVAAAFIVASSLVQLTQGAVRRIISSIILILVVNVILSLTGIDYLGSATHKLAFLFSEPSVLACVAAPFLIYYVKSRSRGWEFSLLMFLLFAIFIQNLTMLVVVLLAFAVGFRVVKLLLLIPVPVALLVSFTNVDYFTSRLVFSLDESNLSGLVFLQGWQNAYLALLDTFGWGSGFQQFGIASPTGEISAMLNALTGVELNLFDGGTTATKLLGEFGLLGAVLDVIFIVRAAQAFWVLKRVSCMPDLVMFARCVDIGILIELFVRGVGYFSPGIFVYLIMHFCNRVLKNRRALDVDYGRALK